MSIPVNIDSVYRDVSVSYSKINGVWRDNEEVWTNINGVWRKAYDINLTEADILGFRLVYRLNKEKTHPDYPHLKYNPEIPVIIGLAGDTAGSMDLEPKSMVFEYTRKRYEQEGIVMYEGTLYAILMNGTVIDVSHPGGDLMDNSTGQDFETYSMGNRLKKLEICLMGYSFYESYGYFMAGWNGFFNKRQFIDQTNFPVKKDKNINLMNSYYIFPSSKRDREYDPVASIGIARDMTSPENNMIGSYGTLDHTIQKITVNDVPKPFVIEYYN